MIFLKKTSRSLKKNLFILKNRFLQHIEDVIHFFGYKDFSFFRMSKEQQEKFEQQEAQWVREQEWTQEKWKKGPALIHTSGRISFFYGQKFDPQYIELVEDGWTHDHCGICYQNLYETDEPEHGEGYTNGYDWICSRCYLKHKNGV